MGGTRGSCSQISSVGVGSEQQRAPGTGDTVLEAPLSLTLGPGAQIPAGGVMWGQHPTAKRGWGGCVPTTTPPPRVVFPRAGRNLGRKIPLQPQQGSWGGVGSSPERGSPQGEGQERGQPAQHQVEERAVAGELGAADGRQALHRHRRRGQGGGRWAQVRDPKIPPPNPRAAPEGGDLGKSVGFGPELVFAWLAAVPRGCWGGAKRCAPRSSG